MLSSIRAAVLSIAALVATCSACRLPSPGAPATSLPEMARESTVKIHGSLGPWEQWTGTGAFVAPDVVMTAGHVCEKDALTTVTLHDGTQLGASVIYDQDEDDDTCLLKVPGAKGRALEVAADEELRLGTPVWYYGFSAGHPALEYGRVAGYEDGYMLVSIDGWNGASGSALLDRYGRVVGILSIKVTPNAHTLGFIPVKYLHKALAAI